MSSTRLDSNLIGGIRHYYAFKNNKLYAFRARFSSSERCREKARKNNFEAGIRFHSIKILSWNRERYLKEASHASRHTYRRKILSLFSNALLCCQSSEWVSFQFNACFLGKRVVCRRLESSYRNHERKVPLKLWVKVPLTSHLFSLIKLARSLPSLFSYWAEELCRNGMT